MGAINILLSSSILVLFPVVELEFTFCQSAYNHLSTDNSVDVSKNKSNEVSKTWITKYISIEAKSALHDNMTYNDQEEWRNFYWGLFVGKGYQK